MDKATFDRIIDSPQTISSQDTELLDELVEAFPYCQTAHLLLAKGSCLKKSMLYPSKLKRAATYILDRRVLHKIITYQAIPAPSNLPDAHEEPSQPSPPQLSSPHNLTLLKELEENIKLIQERKKKENSRSSTSAVESPTAHTSFHQENKPTLPVNLPLSESRLGNELDVQSDKKATLLSTDALLTYISKGLHGTSTFEIHQKAIIDQFIDKSPKISKPKSVTILPENQDLSKSSTELKTELVTENFAQILVKQNKIDKAIEIYKKLILKFPDKSAYFAAKLNELEINNQ